jgi:hypothetical protein
MWSGLTEPVSCNRCISFTAAQGLTSKRTAVWQIELFFSVARTKAEADPAIRMQSL